MAGVQKGTVNRLSPKTASKVLEETMPRSDKPLQILSTDDEIRSVHGVAYTRLWNAELLDVVASTWTTLRIIQTLLSERASKPDAMSRSSSVMVIWRCW